MRPTQAMQPTQRPAPVVASDASVVGISPADAATEPLVVAEPALVDAGVSTDAYSPKGKTKSESRPVSSDSDLAVERALVELARTAITRGDASTALEELDKHARVYRKGRLAEERDALWVQALVQAGFPSKAKAKAASFRKRYPRSLFLPVVEHALGELL